MEQSNFKNTIVLKNIPSNIIEEAIIVFKENKKAWKLEKVDNRKNIMDASLKPIKKDYVVKEAELIVSEYVKEIGNQNKIRNIKNKNIKYKRLKHYAYFTTFLLLLQMIMNLIN